MKRFLTANERKAFAYLFSLHFCQVSFEALHLISLMFYVALLKGMIYVKLFVASDRT